MAANGIYEAPGQVPIIVVDGGDLPNGMHGPWVRYRFPWEKDEEAVAVLWTEFDMLQTAAGYRLVEPTTTHPTGTKGGTDP